MKYVFFMLSVMSFNVQAMLSLDKFLDESRRYPEPVDRFGIHVLHDRIIRNVSAKLIDSSNFKLSYSYYSDEFGYLFSGEEDQIILFSGADWHIELPMYRYGSGVLELASLPGEEKAWSLKISIEEKEKYACPKMGLTEISGNLKAALYCSVPGDGHGFVLALGGDIDSDTSIEKVQRHEPLGDAILYYCYGRLNGFEE